MIPRRTLASPAEFSGRGLFSGAPARVVVGPSEPGSGITLHRADSANSAPFAATIGSLAAASSDAPGRNTTLAGPGGPILTVEHLLSALAGLGITDAAVEVFGPEVPIGDGSAGFICDALLRAGVRELPQTIEPITLTREITVEAPGGGRINARPRQVPGCSYTYELDYGPGAPIPTQRANWTRTPHHPITSSPHHESPSALAYAREIAPARTFCLRSEAEQMRAAGLFKDFSARDLLVIGPRGPIDNAYRFENEPARHKLLDLIGDLALASHPIQADIIATRAGHGLNHQLARALAQAAQMKPGL